MDDLISRQAALALAKDICVPIKDGTVYRHRCIDPQQIMDLPSTEPERKKGRWEMEWLPSTNGGHYQIFRCNQCHTALNWQMNFCGNCGADMRGDEE